MHFNLSYRSLMYIWFVVVGCLGMYNPLVL